MTTELVITASAHGWRVRDAEERIPPSIYPAIEDAKREAHDYLVHHGGGRLTILEGSTVVWATTIDPEESDSAGV